MCSGGDGTLSGRLEMSNGCVEMDTMRIMLVPIRNDAGEGVRAKTSMPHVN